MDTPNQLQSHEYRFYTNNAAHWEIGAMDNGNFIPHWATHCLLAGLYKILV